MPKSCYFHSWPQWLQFSITSAVQSHFKDLQWHKNILSEQDVTYDMHVWYLIFCIRKWNSTHEGSFQSDFIYQYKEIFKSNPLQKIKKWNQFGLNTVHLCMYNSWPIPVHFVKKILEENEKLNKKAQKSIISLTRLGSVAKMWELFKRGHHVLCGLTKKNGLHTKKGF